MKYLLILLFAVVFIEAAVSQQIDEEACLKNVTSHYPNTPLTLIVGKFYYFSSQWGNWQNADEFCRSINLQLVSFEDLAEQLAVENWMIKQFDHPNDASFWTSGKRNSEGNFFWTATNKAVDMNREQWLPNQPDNYENNENCLILRHRRSDSKMLLNDVNCDHLRYRSICERNI